MCVNHLNLVPVCKDICEVESENPWSLPDATNYKTIKRETQVLGVTQIKVGEGYKGHFAWLCRKQGVFFLLSAAIFSGCFSEIDNEVSPSVLISLRLSFWVKFGEDVYSVHTVWITISNWIFSVLMLLEYYRFRAFVDIQRNDRWITSYENGILLQGNKRHAIYFCRTKAKVPEESMSLAEVQWFLL